jgi:predicted RNA binding protein YcfA (HicA-like mRNA interferase family)
VFLWAGFLLVRRKGSHRHFRNNHGDVITIKEDNPLKGKNQKPPQVVSQWSLQIQVAGDDPIAMATFRHAVECFVLITNVSPEEFGMREVLGTYKNQISSKTLLPGF